MTVPKKIDKFNNFVSNSFKIKDDAVSRRDLGVGMWSRTRFNVNFHYCVGEERTVGICAEKSFMNRLFVLCQQLFILINHQSHFSLFIQTTGKKNKKKQTFFSLQLMISLVEKIIVCYNHVGVGEGGKQW